MIATLFGKKKISEEKLANVFVNAVLETDRAGLPAGGGRDQRIARVRSEPRPLAKPTTRLRADRARREPDGSPAHPGPGLDKRMPRLAISKFAQATGRSVHRPGGEVRTLQGQMERLNFPSKNTVYAMGKVLFHRYDLFCFQDSTSGR
jgi:hypothetical protein